jgi:hypothetical protein
MARAIIHNSDYASAEHAQAAITWYLEERNKIWGKERSPSSFRETNNCKDARYR